MFLLFASWQLETLRVVQTDRMNFWQLTSERPDLWFVNRAHVATLQRVLQQQGMIKVSTLALAYNNLFFTCSVVQYSVSNIFFLASRLLVRTKVMVSCAHHWLFHAFKKVHVTPACRRGVHRLWFQQWQHCNSGHIILVIFIFIY